MGVVMRKLRLWVTILNVAIYFGCGVSNNRTAETGTQSTGSSGEIKILQSWHGDYPVDQLRRLPEKQREKAVGFIDNSKTFADVWKAFRQGETVPEIEFKTNIVLFARNTEFYNRISIGRVNVKNGVAELLAMETMSAMPIEDKVAMSMVLVAKKGIEGLKAGDDIIQISNF
jgi:hypothetical protein